MKLLSIRSDFSHQRSGLIKCLKAWDHLVVDWLHTKAKPSLGLGFISKHDSTKLQLSVRHSFDWVKETIPSYLTTKKTLLLTFRQQVSIK
ncbi:hypothetical protein PoB_007119300 [Plakobranchus ocellatus]|uniref:Uncharacterized protein n=1 Tax=Plakobranchus ocellatus TaxID=259542 RepID=A0AAV4DK87_9GAST|nr:hypothetical protein PoB_007119300 [Plakobranchus ocellatus]